MFGPWRFSAFASNCDVTSRSHLLKIISHPFSILMSVESASIPFTGSIGLYKYGPIFSSKIANVTHLGINLLTCVVPKKPLGPFLWL